MRKTKKAVASLAIAGMVLSMAPMSVFGATTDSNRLAGAGRVETAIAVANQGWANGSDSVIVVPADDANIVDALAAAPLAGQLKAPILVTYRDALDANVAKEIKDLGAKNVYAVGALSADTIASLKAISGVTVTTLQGADRTDTAAKVAAQLTNVKGSFVVAYNGTADALSAASFAAANGYSIIVANPDGSIPSGEAAYKVAPTYTVGGQVRDAGATALYGADRYATNDAVLNNLNYEYDKVYVANGETLVDALAGAPLAAQTKSPIVLADATTAATGANDNLTDSSKVIALGGTGAVSDAVLSQVNKNNIGNRGIVSVSALDDTNRFLEINFAKPVSDLEPSDITIQNADTLDRYGVKAVTLSADGLTATVELYAQEDSESVLEYLQDYTVTVNNNGTILKATFNRPAYEKDRITDVDPANGTFRIGAITINVPSDKDFDYADALGRKARVWYNVDRDLVKITFESETVVTGGVEVTQTRNTAAGDNGKIKIADKEYTLADSYEIYENDKSSTLAPDNTKYDYAKVFFNKNGDVELIEAYYWDEFMVVSEVEDNVAISYDDSELDLEDYLVTKDGKTIAPSDLEAGDILYFDAGSNDEDGFAVVYNNSVTGEIQDVFKDDIRINDKTYTYTASRYTNAAVQYLDGDEFKDLDSDIAEELQAGGEVTLFLDHKGNAVYITGDQAAVASNDLGLHLTEDVVFYNQSGVTGREMLELEGVNGNGDEKLYTFRVDTLKTVTGTDGKEYKVDRAYSDAVPTKIDKFALSDVDPGGGDTNIIAKDKDGNTLGTIVTDLEAKAADNEFIEIQTDDEGTITGLTFMTEGDLVAGSLELDDKYVNSKLLKSSTVVFDGAKGWDVTYKPSADDITVTTWGDLSEKGFKITDASYYVNSKNEVKYLVIKNSDAEQTTDVNGVVTKVLRNTDGDIVELTVMVDGVKKTYTADKVDDAAVKGDLVTLKVNDDNGVVEDIVAPTIKTGVVTAVSVADREVTIDASGTGAGTYKLVSDGSVLNAKNTSDILVKALRDIAVGDNVRLSLDENSSGDFIDVVEILSSGSAVLPPTGAKTVDFINSDGSKAQIGGTLYTLNGDTILYDENGTIKQIGNVDIETVLTAGTAVTNIVVTNGVVESLKLAEVTVTATPATVTLAAAGTQAITASADVAGSVITYASSDGAVATVAADGTITAVAAGTATITVTATHAGYVTGTATVTVTVTP